MGEEALVNVQHFGNSMGVQSCTKSADVQLIQFEHALQEFQCQRSQPGVVPRRVRAI
jgi:hypothetical protein